MDLTGTMSYQSPGGARKTSDPPSTSRDMLPWILPSPLLPCSPRAWPRLLLKAATVLQPQPDFRYQRKGEISLSSAMFTFDSKQLSVPGSRPSCVTHSRHLLAELLVLPV